MTSEKSECSRGLETDAPSTGLPRGLLDSTEFHSLDVPGVPLTPFARYFFLVPKTFHTVLQVVARPTAVAAVALPALVVGALPAHADEAVPPNDMSTVGGERLGQPGTQVAPEAGAEAPALPKGLTARSWIVADAETGEVLAAHNAHWRLAPASTLKMLFADTLLPKFDKEMKYTVLPEDLAGMGAGSSAVGIKEDLSYKVDDFWNGVFLASGNDAVHALVALNGGMAKTVREMNERAAELGAEDTHVVSPDGYDAKGQTSSAYDLTLIARAAMQNKDFRDYAATVRTEFPGGYDKKGEREHFTVETTNRLMRGDVNLEPYEGLAGVKNGYTSNAGYTFTGIAEKDDRKLLVTVMHPDKDAAKSENDDSAGDEGSEDQRDEESEADTGISDHNDVYRETAKLLDWGFEAAGSVKPVGELVPPESEQEKADSAESAQSTPLGGEQTASDTQPSGGLGVAFGITGGLFVVLGVLGYVVHRRWPLPAAFRRESATAPTERGGSVLPHRRGKNQGS